MPIQGRRFVHGGFDFCQQLRQALRPARNLTARRSLRKCPRRRRLCAMTYRRLGKTQRLWRWPLRSGLATTLALMGTPHTLLTACGLVDDGEGGTLKPASNSGTGGATGTGAQSGNSSVGGAVLSTGGASCRLDADAGTVFLDEVFSLNQPWPLVLYSWTTTEQVA